MNKTEDIEDLTSLPNDSIAISAKTGKGIESLKRAILQAFSTEYHFLELFVPYAQMSDYAKLKPYLKERSSKFTDDGQELSVIIPTRYADKLTPFLKTKSTIKS